MKKLALPLTLLGLATVYLFSLSPFVQSGDSGEFVVAGSLLRVPHPPGYPLYTFLAHLFTYIPISTPAWRIGLFSVVAQLAAAAIFFDIIRRWKKDEALAVILTLAAGLTPVVWTYATEAEVFALNNLFTLATLWLIYRYSESRAMKWAYLSCLMAGFAFSHHQTSIFVTFPAVAVFLWIDRKKLFHPLIYIKGLALFALGLTPWLLLFPLAKNNDILSWGDFSTWKGFFIHVTRAEYGTFSMSTGGRQDTNVIVKLAVFFWQMIAQTYLIGFAAVLAAIFIKQKAWLKDHFAMAITIAFVIYALCMNILSNIDPTQPLFFFVTIRMWILPILLLWILAATALPAIAEHLGRRKQILAGLLLVTLAGASYQWLRYVSDKSRDNLLEQAGRSMLEAVAPNAILLIRGDMQLGITRYLRYVQNIRPDVNLISMELIGYPWAYNKVKAAIPEFRYPGELPEYANDPNKRTFNEVALANITRFPIYLPQLDPQEAEAHVQGLEGFIVGFMTRVFHPLRSWNLEEIEKEIVPFMNIKTTRTSRYPWFSWEHFIRERYFHSKMAIAASFAYRANGDPRFIKRAEEIFTNVMNESDDHKVIAKMQIAYLYTDLTKQDLKHKDRAIKEWKEYLELNTGFSPEAQQARANLAELENLAR